MRSDLRSCAARRGHWDCDPGFSIFDPGDLETIVAELFATADRGRARAAQWKISAWKNALMAPKQALERPQDDDERAAARAYAHYDETLAAYQAVDFDDLIVRPVAASRARRRGGRPLAGALRASCWSTSIRTPIPAQYRLLRALVGTTTPFTVVGDDDQAIYGWRGATLDNLASLAARLPESHRHQARAELPVHGPHPALRQRADHAESRSCSTRSCGATSAPATRCASTPAADDEAEAEMVVHRISALSSRRAKYADFAILYRGNHQARVFETALRTARHSVRDFGRQSMFDSTEIKDIVAYLRLIANDDDDPAFVRAITAPKRGVGETTLARLGEIGVARGARASSRLPSIRRLAPDPGAADGNGRASSAR